MNTSKSDGVALGLLSADRGETASKQRNCATLFVLDVVAFESIDVHSDLN